MDDFYLHREIQFGELKDPEIGDSEILVSFANSMKL
jgi:hypothetical protein